MHYCIWCWWQVGDGRARWQRETCAARRMWTSDRDGGCQRSTGGHNKLHVFLWSHAKSWVRWDPGPQVAACRTTRDTLQTLQPASQCSWILLCWSKQLFHQLSEKGETVNDAGTVVELLLSHGADLLSLVYCTVMCVMLGQVLRR